MLSAIEHPLKLLERKNPLLAFRMRGCSSLGAALPFQKMTVDDHAQVLFIYRLASMGCLEDLVILMKDKNLQVIVFETSVADVAFHLENPNISRLLQHAQFEWYLVEDVSEELMLKIAWQTVFLSRQWVVGITDDLFLHFKKNLELYLDQVFVDASQVADYGIKFCRNIYANVPNIRYSRLMRDAPFHNIPALICGAGPSLAKQYDCIKQHHDNVMIFAGGSAIAALSSAGIHPHVVGMIDPEPPYTRFKMEASLENIPLFYQLRAEASLVTLFHGPKILIASPGEDLGEKEIFKILAQPTSSIDRGVHVANFMTTLAVTMGCNPIILVGMDMIYEQGHEYALGVVDDGMQKKNEIHYALDLNGQKRLSRKDLLMGRDFFSSLVAEYPTCQFINATYEGLRIEGMKHALLEEVIPEISYDIQGWLHTGLQDFKEIQQQELAGVIEMMEKIRSSHERSEEILTRILTRLEQHYLQQNRNPSKTWDGLALEEIELEEELFFRLYLEPLWNKWKWVIFRNQQKEKETIQGRMQQTLFCLDVIRAHRILLKQIKY